MWLTELLQNDVVLCTKVTKRLICQEVYEATRITRVLVPLIVAFIQKDELLSWFEEAALSVKWQEALPRELLDPSAFENLHKFP